MSLFDKYQALVGRAQGATRFFIKGTGNLNVGDTATVDGTDFTGTQLLNIFLANGQRASFTMASAIQTVSVIPITAGLVDIFYPSATTSVKLPVANVGAALVLRFGSTVASQISFLPGSNAAGSAQSIACGPSNLSVLMASYNGAASLATIKLICVSAGCWQIAESNSWNAVFFRQDG